MYRNNFGVPAAAAAATTVAEVLARSTLQQEKESATEKGVQDRHPHLLK